jgi:hypothetical protein
MALQTSGQISMSNIANEKGETLSDVSLAVLSEENLNEDFCNPANNTASQPYGISEFYGYDHKCVTQSILYKISMSGGYRSPEEACGDRGRGTEPWIMYSDCEPEQYAIGSGCLIFEDSKGNSLWPRNEWYYHELTNTSYFISRGEIVDELPCFK